MATRYTILNYNQDNNTLEYFNAGTYYTLNVEDMAVLSTVLTGFSSGAGVVSAADTVLSAFGKLDGNIAAKLGTALTDGRLFVGNASNIATGVALSGEATIINTGALTLANSAVIGKVLTGYSSGAGTVASTDTILQAIQKLNGNDALNLPLTGGTMTGAITQQKAPIIPTADYTASTATPVTPDARLVSVYNVTVDANLTINGFSNPYSGQKIILQLHNDASHAVTFATGSGNFRFGTDITSYTATASKTDYVGVVWNAADSRWDIVSLIQGF